MPVPVGRVGGSRERNSLAYDNKRGAAALSRRHGIHNRGSCRRFSDGGYDAGQSATELMMADDFPLSILNHRISTLREKLHGMYGQLASLSGDERAKLSERIAAEAKELDGLVAERDILAADAR
jgi:hypothetical protein